MTHFVSWSSELGKFREGMHLERSMVHAKQKLDTTEFAMQTSGGVQKDMQL